MSERNCPDDMAAEWEHKQERMCMSRLTAHPDCRDPAHPGCSQCRDELPVEPADMRGDIAHLVDNAREFAEGGDRYTGPEVRLWIYKLCDEIERLYDADASLTKAYAEGRKDQRADDAKAIEALVNAICLGLA